MAQRFLQRSHLRLASHKSYLTTAQYIVLLNYLQKTVFLHTIKFLRVLATDLESLFKKYHKREDLNPCRYRMTTIDHDQCSVLNVSSA